MSHHRVFVALALLATVAIALAADKPNNVIVGSRVNGDYLLQREFIDVPSKVLQIVKDRRTFPGNNFSKITQVKLLDQRANGATAVLTNGGPGLSYATAEFKSKRGHGIHYIAEIYGK